MIKFLVSEWQKPKYAEKLHDKDLYVTYLDNCWKITDQSTEQVHGLSTQQEEADGCLLLHAAHAVAEGYSAIVICSEDTDVFILCLAFSERLNVPLFQKCGTQSRTRLVDITSVSSALGSDVCKALLGVHSFTGCDSVSAFAGRGKQRAFQIIKSDQNARNVLGKLGETWTLSSDMHSQLERFACKLYATKPGTHDINELRYNLFCARKGEIESHQLPPSKDCLMKHSLRANYQAAIWKRSLENDPQAPNPVGLGWQLEECAGTQHLVIDWMGGSPAPEAILELLSCKCTRSCKSPSCVCIANGLKCTDMCRLMNCDNQPQESETLEENEHYDGDDDDNEDSF